jgi:glycolate oxidase iron-sulfur subunit
VEIGRQIVDAQVQRPLPERTARWLLREGLTSALFAPAMRVGQALRPLLPRVLKNKVPPRTAAHGTAAHRTAAPRVHQRTILMLRGCVQPSMMPNIDRAAAHVLDRAGIQTVFASGTGCCGAVRAHLSDPDGGLEDMRRNIDAWWPMVSAGGVHAIVASASACSLAIKEYAHALSGDAAYADKAARISGLARDLSELLPQLLPVLQGRMRSGGPRRLAFHAPCTLQHGQKLKGGIEAGLRTLGFEVDAANSESHWCCGSAGTYSILQPDLAMELRDRKLGLLAKQGPQCIVSANVGCIQHLQSGTRIPVKHWIEVLDEALLPESGEAAAATAASGAGAA